MQVFHYSVTFKKERDYILVKSTECNRKVTCFFSHLLVFLCSTERVKRRAGSSPYFSRLSSTDGLAAKIAVHDIGTDSSHIKKWQK